MKIAKKILSVALAALTLASSGPTAVLAQQNLGRANSAAAQGANGVSAASLGRRNGGAQAGRVSSPVTRSTVVGVKAAPRASVSRGMRIQGLPDGKEFSSLNPAGESMSSPEMGAPFQAAQEIGNGMINGSADKAAAPAEQAPKTNETAALDGQVKFDGAAEKKADAVIASESKPASLPAATAATQQDGANIPPKPYVATNKKDTWINRIALLAQFGIYMTVAHFSDSAAAALIVTGFLSSLRYAPDWFKIWTSEKYTKYGPFGRVALAFVVFPAAAALTFFGEVVDYIVYPLARSIKDAAVWVYDNILAPLGRFIRDLAKAAWELVKDFARAIRDFVKAAWQTLKDLARAAWEKVKAVARAIRDFVKAAWENLKAFARAAWEKVKAAARWVWEGLKNVARFVRDLAKAAWELVKDFAKAAWEFAKKVGRALRTFLGNVYDYVIVPVAKAVRAFLAAALAGSVSAAIGLGLAAALGLNFLVNPLLKTLSFIGKLNFGGKLMAAVFGPAFLIAAATIVGAKAWLGLAALSLGAGALAGFGIGSYAAIKAGYTEGFFAGVKKGVTAAAASVEKAFGEAKGKYQAWNLQK